METLKKILIVDDEKFVTDTLAGFFRTKGYLIFKAEDGQATLDIIKNETLDLVLLDIKLPKVDGIEILRLLRQDYPKVRVVVMTAYDLEYKNRVDEFGCDAFFIKPLLIDELMQKVEELLSAKEMPLEARKEKIETVSFPLREPEFGILEEMLPKARILIVSPRDLISDLIKGYFSKREICNGIYEVVESGLEQLEQIKKFQPDIILLDVILIGLLGEFGLTLMKLPYPPKDIILFGDPAAKWDEVETLIKRGIRFIEIPQDLYSRSYPIKETIQRLDNAIREVCVKYALFNKGGH